MLRRFTTAALAGLAVAALSVTVAQDADDVQAPLAQLKKVGREGKGNAEAAKAWKALVNRGTPALIPILGAMDDDDLTSANWLRPAFEAIAEKALEAKQLPKSDLEKFIADTKKAGIARRLAYEWLVKIDPDAPNRYLPGMLLDPSHELRRDAIERAIKDAEALTDKGDDKAARALYQKALKGACDQDHVEAIAKALEKSGDKVDQAKHFGFVTKWHLVAPFDNVKGVGYDRVYPPEKGVDLTASYDGKEDNKVAWVPSETKGGQGMADLNAALGKFKGAVAYAYAVVDSPKEQPVDVRVGCITSLKIWLNGKQIFAHDEYHHGMRMDQYVARATLKKGKNEILVKVCQNEQKDAWAQVWQLQLRLCDRVGSAVPFTQAAAKKEDK
jgi:hypothetical protein